VGNSILTIIWHLLADPDATYHDLGPGYYDSRITRQRRKPNLIRQPEQLTGPQSRPPASSLTTPASAERGHRPRSLPRATTHDFESDICDPRCYLRRR